MASIYPSPFGFLNRSTQLFPAVHATWYYDMELKGYDFGWLQIPWFVAMAWLHSTALFVIFTKMVEFGILI